MKYFPSNHMIELIKNGNFEMIRDVVKKYNVTTLDFSHKDINDESAPMIAKAIEGLDITCVNLSYNLLGAQGAKEFVEQLQNSKVQEIDFSRNSIGDAVADLMRAITTSSIKVVKLAYNHIGRQGLNELQPILVGSNVKADLSHNKTWV